MRTLVGHKFLVMAVAYSPDSRLVASRIISTPLREGKTSCVRCVLFVVSERRYPKSQGLSERMDTLYLWTLPAAALELHAHLERRVVDPLFKVALIDDLPRHLPRWAKQMPHS